MYEPGTILRCVKVPFGETLTKGALYVVHKNYAEWDGIIIKDNVGSYRYFDPSLFEFIMAPWDR